MRIGTTADITDVESLRQIKQAGFDCIDAQGLVNVEGALHSLPDDELERVAKDAKEVLDSLGLFPSQLHGPWRYPPQDDDPAMRDQWLTFCERAIRVCAILRCKHFVIHPLMPFGREDPDPAFSRALNRTFLTNLSTLGEKFGVVICVENMPFGAQSLARVAPLLELVKEINSPYLRICLDTGHCMRVGDSPADAVRLLGKQYLAVLHVHDNDGTADQHREPWQGSIDWDDFTKALAEIDFDGTVSMELSYRSWCDAEDKELYYAHVAELARRVAGNI